ncbi:MAG: hypothetical protein AB1730_09075 [Myxococcota bacterium]|jgi:uncharacterized membrane protein
MPCKVSPCKLSHDLHVRNSSERAFVATSPTQMRLGIVGLAVAGAVWDALHPSGGWGGPVPMAAQAAGVVLGFVLGVLAGSLVHPLRGLFVSQREQDDEVRRAAWAAFTGSRVSETAGRTGLLVYVSLFEHRVVVLLDSGVRAVVSADFPQTLVARAVEGLGAGERAEALADKLPARGKNPNELPNHVIALHPR